MILEKINDMEHKLYHFIPCENPNNESQFRLVEINMNDLEGIFEYSKMFEFYNNFETTPHKTIKDVKGYVSNIMERVKKRLSDVSAYGTN